MDKTDVQSNTPITDTTDEQLLEGDQQETVDQVAEQVEEAPVVDTPNEPAEPKTRSERRSEDYINKLSQMISSSNQNAYRQKSEPQDSPKYEPLKYEEGEFDLDKLEQDRSAYGQAQRAQAIQESEQALTPIKQQIWGQQLELDDERVQKVWDILDKSDESKYDPDFANQMFQKYINFIGYSQSEDGRINIDRPNIRWADFVRAEKQNFDRYAERVAQVSTTNIKKQATNAGIRPSGQARSSATKSVDTSDPRWLEKMSREDYDAFGRDLADKMINESLGIKK